MKKYGFFIVSALVLGAFYLGWKFGPKMPYSKADQNPAWPGNA